MTHHVLVLLILELQGEQLPHRPVVNEKLPDNASPGIERLQPEHGMALYIWTCVEHLLHDTLIMALAMAKPHLALAIPAGRSSEEIAAIVHATKLTATKRRPYNQVIQVEFILAAAAAARCT